MTPPQIFDRAARRLRRDRVARDDVGPLEPWLAEALSERLDAITRPFAHALVINDGHGSLSAMLEARGIAVTRTDIGARFAARSGALQCDEDRLAAAPGAFDIVIAPWGLDTVDDLPGALILARRALRSDGVFLAMVPASPSLPALRHAIAVADAADGRAVARIHPQIDVRAAGDLLVRAGFALPVADSETVRIAYRDVAQLFADLRASGMSNVLTDRNAVTRNWVARTTAAFVTQGDEDGRVIETVTMVTLTGWAPASSQPLPARRGSGTASFADVLKRKA